MHYRYMTLIAAICLSGCSSQHNPHETMEEDAGSTNNLCCLTASNTILEVCDPSAPQWVCNGSTANALPCSLGACQTGDLCVSQDGNSGTIESCSTPLPAAGPWCCHTPTVLESCNDVPYDAGDPMAGHPWTCYFGTSANPYPSYTCNFKPVTCGIGDRCQASDDSFGTVEGCFTSNNE